MGKHSITTTTSNSPTTAKLTVLGTGGAGKTALVVQYVHSHFCEAYDPTIEDIHHRQVLVDDRICMADILDTAGQDEYTALRHTWYQGTDGFILVYNMCSRNSFEETMTYLPQIQRALDYASVPFVIVATHADEANLRTVSAEEGMEFAKSCGELSAYFEVSNKLRINVDEALSQAIRLVRINQNGQVPTKAEKKARKYKENCTIL